MFLKKIWKKYAFLLLLAFVVLGLFDLRFAIGAILCMVAPIGVSFVKGRFWCGNLCPRGSFYEQVMYRFAGKKQTPAIIKSKGFRFFMVLFMLSMFGFGIVKNWGNWYGVGMVFYRIIVVTTIVGILLSLRYNHRTWCSFCPMGSLAAFVSQKRKSKRVLTISDACVSCKLCEKKCALGIVPYQYKGNVLEHPDCIQCGRCAAVCPKQAIGYDNVA
ncbi:MAG: ferredoxin-type protein NapH [Clostridiales bacterium]|nr:ferredoxin-type protein NapH [Clostridiales bacterium]